MPNTTVEAIFCWSYGDSAGHWQTDYVELPDYTGDPQDVNALDDCVQYAAALLGRAYDRDVTIRFNSDRESGGAFLVTHAVDGVGANSEVGICASVVTERTRARWQRNVERRAVDDPEWAADMRERLATEPEGTLRVYAHLSREACDAVALAQTGGRYYHRPAADVAAALAFVRAHGSLAHLERS
jgi:hypothetical protein